METFARGLHFLCYNEIMKEISSSIIALICTGCVYLLGGWDVSLICLVIAIVIDYVSGIMKAFVMKELSSKIGLRGLLKKVGVLMVVMLAVIVDRVTGETGMIRSLVIYYFVANEGLSIIENLGQTGVPIPSSIKKALRALKKENK